MKLIDIANKSTVILTGTIIPNRMQTIYRILYNNLSLLSKFKNIVVTLNESNNDCREHTKIYRNIFENIKNDVDIYHLTDVVNRGWQFGTMDIEKMSYEFINANLNTDYIVKMDFDIYLDDTILNIDISDGDVFIMPSIGYSTVSENYVSNMDKLINLYDDINPQSTFYILLKPVDYLYENSDYINLKYNQWVKNPVGDGPHHIGVACEPFLKAGFIRNKLKIKNIISKNTFIKLLELIYDNKIVDPSHKNIFFNEVGICHLSDENLQIFKI